ncbi:hypothetical protein [Nocardioides sambongensis]|uniref:hypothetical protein n=1 Tax=Nocardioides sambongensis TaxID=2589074 RepID=UPI00112634D2|nr:hypothetical protein [Nocardioides sambongensis]
MSSPDPADAGRAETSAVAPRPLFPLITRVLPFLLGTLVVAFVLGAKRSAFASTDTYFHLRFGDEFLGGWTLRDPGQVGASGSADWVPTQWLSQITLAWTWDHLGSRGFSALFLTLTGALLVGLYLLARTRGRPIPAAGITLLAAVGLSPWISMRPQMVSFIALTAVLLGWHHARLRGTTPWWLIPLAWVWAMCHGLWVVGVVVSLALAVGLIIDQRPRRADAARWLAVPAGMVAVAMVTPVGPALVGAVLEVNSRSDHFGEWAAPDYATLTLLPAAVIVGSGFLIGLRRPPLSAYDVAQLVLAGGLALYSERTIPLAVIIAAPITAELWSRRRYPRPPVGRREIGLVTLVAAAVVIGTTLAGSATRPGAAADLEPFADRLARLPAGTPVLTDRSYGAALMWTDPDLDIPVHGYGDVYTDEELDRLDAMSDLEPGWDTTVGDLGVTVAVLPEDSALGYALQREGWVVVDHTDALDYLRAPAG